MGLREIILLERFKAIVNLLEPAVEMWHGIEDKEFISLLNDGYPFNKSIDEQVCEMRAWITKVEKAVEKSKKK